MKIDLLKIVEENKKIEEQENILERKREIRELISAIVKGEDIFYTNDEELIKEIGIKVSKKDMNYNNPWYSPFSINGKIKIKLNKTNIQKIQDYINKEEK